MQYTLVGKGMISVSHDKFNLTWKSDLDVEIGGFFLIKCDTVNRMNWLNS